MTKLVPRPKVTSPLRAKGRYLSLDRIKPVEHFSHRLGSTTACGDEPGWISSSQLGRLCGPKKPPVSATSRNDARRVELDGAAYLNT